MPSKSFYMIFSIEFPWEKDNQVSPHIVQLIDDGLSIQALGLLVQL